MRKSLKMLFAAVLTMSVCSIDAQVSQTIPMDEAVRTGTLSNGLTYYIRYNNTPEHVANFYIAQKVGSINEDDDQRGLAHFLEHMAFNGSEHFKGNGIIEYTRSLGVQFGRDLNAYTSIDRTVYNIDNVPTYRQTSVDSCLLILKDWSNGLSLEADEIDKERGVVHNEWRLGSGPMQRMRDAMWPELLKDSKYGHRQPIGLMSIIDSFKPATLRAYYEKWYRPDNQGIIVVGDVDVDKVEAKIKDLWADVTVPADAAKIKTEDIPDNNEAIIVIGKDKEQSQNLYMVMMKHDVFPDAMKNNIAYFIVHYGETLMSDMLNTRLQDLAQEPNSAFSLAQVNDDNFMSAKTKKAFTIVIVPKENQDEEALRQVMREVTRAQKFGFTESEYDRAKKEFLSQLEKAYENRDKTKSENYAMEYIENFLEKEPCPGIEFEYETMKTLSPLLPIDVANEMAGEYISVTDTNLVVGAFLQERDGAVYPTKESIKKVIDEVRAEEYQPYAEEVIDEPLIAAMPKKGKISKETVNKDLGFKEWQLSNGARVQLKQTDFKNDEVLLNGLAKGGMSLYGAADYDNLKLMALGLGETGLGNFSSNKLTKALAGKNAEVNFSVDMNEQRITGKSTPKDLETLMQLIYLNFTASQPDQAAYDQMAGLYEQVFKNASLNPQLVLADSMQQTLTCHSQLQTLPKAETFKTADYNRMVQIKKERMANAADYTFIFVGNFDEATLRSLVEQYIASLPGNAKKKSGANDIRKIFSGHVENRFTAKMKDAQSQVVEVWRSNAMDYTLENRVKLQAAADVLEAIYLKTIREETSASYTVGSNGEVDAEGKDIYFVLTAQCPCDPSKAELAERLIKEGIEGAASKIDDDVFNKVKEALLKKADTNFKENSYWSNVIYRYDRFGVDCATEYKKVVSQLTPASISSFIRNTFLNSGHHAEIVMMPEAAE